MSRTVDLKCACGQVKGNIEIVPNSFFHVHCLCSDCQDFAAYLNNSDKILDKHGGSELFQTYPAFIRITEGNDNIRCMQLNHKGIYRWYTSCCKMPIANTMRSAKLPFAGISVKLMQFSDESQKEAALGPVTLKAFAKSALGEMPKDAHPKFPISFMPKIMLFMFKGLVTGKYKPSPFFQGNSPISKAKI